MARWEETSYPVPTRALRITCVSCGIAIAGGVRGSRNIRSILKEVKAHDDSRHPPYDPAVIQLVAHAVAELNDGSPTPRRVGRLSVDLAEAGAALAWRLRAEVLERHLGILVEEKAELEAALNRLRHERDLAVLDREHLRSQLVEAQKELEVLGGVRDALRAELVKAQPSRRTTSLLAEVSKASAAAVAGALITVGAQWSLGLQSVERDATTVVNHADVVISDCSVDAP